MSGVRDALRVLAAWFRPSRSGADGIDRCSVHEYQSELELKRAEIAALQSQINPHFLYNTLESIRGQALWDGADEIAEMTETLSLFFRYGISTKGSLVRLEDELRYVQYYFRILKYRFDERFSFRIINEDNDDQLLSCALPKLTIQPLVENAVFHGLESRSGPGKIEVRFAATERTLRIRIIDDGIGMDAAVLDQINARLRHPRTKAYENENGHHAGIAIGNINDRIKLYFGPDYGVYVSSAPEVGTEVEIVVPKSFENDAEASIRP